MTTTLCAVVDTPTWIVLSTQQVTDPVNQQAPPAGTFFVPCDNTVTAGAQYNNPSDGVFAPAGSPLISASALNQATLRSRVAAALTRLRQIQTQASAFAAQAPYGTANLANLNDLLAKSQLIATAVGDVSTDLIAAVRILSNQYDGTT